MSWFRLRAAARNQHHLVKFETFRVIEQRRQIDQNAHGSNLSRISREPYGFSQLRSAKGFQAESFRRTAHLRHPAVRFHDPGTRDEPIDFEEELSVTPCLVIKSSKSPGLLIETTVSGASH
jgi:hypothetical protein